MNRSGQALTFSLLYSLPLLVWLIARLHYIEWTTNELHWLLGQTWRIIVLLQAGIIPLLFIAPSCRAAENQHQPAHPDNTLTDDLLAMLHILLYPLPLLTLIWLGGGATLHTLLAGLALVVIVAAISLLIQLGRQLVRKRQSPLSILPSLAQLLLVVSLWNFRDAWFAYLGL